MATKANFTAEEWEDWSTQEWFRVLHVLPVDRVKSTRSSAAASAAANINHDG